MDLTRSKRSRALGLWSAMARCRQGAAQAAAARVLPRMRSQQRGGEGSRGTRGGGLRASIKARGREPCHARKRKRRSATLTEELEVEGKESRGAGGWPGCTERQRSLELEGAGPRRSRWRRQAWSRGRDAERGPWWRWRGGNEGRGEEMGSNEHLPELTTQGGNEGEEGIDRDVARVRKAAGPIARRGRLDWTNGPRRSSELVVGQVAAGLGGPARLFSLLYPSLYINREIRERKREKRRLEEEFGHVVNFLGLTKICLVREN